MLGIVESDAIETDPRRLRMILIAMCAALSAVMASVSGLNVAQQQLAVDLDATQSMLLWIINGYTLALAALLLPVGAIGDRFGRKTMILPGLVVFALANVAAAASTTATMMLVARVVSGVGAAMIMPVTLSVITSSFPVAQRGKAVGVWAAYSGAGGIIGLFFSSAVVDWIHWRWLFALPILLAAGAFAMTVVYVRNSHEGAHGSFDLGGSVLSAIAAGSLVLGVHEGPDKGWTHVLTVASLIVGVASLVAFILWELRVERPLLDVRQFSNRWLSTGMVNLTIGFAVIFGLFLVLVQYMQAVLGYSALRASASLLPFVIVQMPLSIVAPRIAARIGSRATMLIGAGLFGLGLAMMAAMASADSIMTILPGDVVLGMGMGLLMTPSTIAITQALPVDKQGVASALNDTSRELGGALGIALLGSVLNSGYRSSIADTVAALPEELREPVRTGIGSGLQAAAGLTDGAVSVTNAIREAFVDGVRSSLWVSFAVAVVPFVVVLFVPPRRLPSETSTQQADVDVAAPLASVPDPAT